MKKLNKTALRALAGLIFLAIGGGLLLASRVISGYADHYAASVYTFLVNTVGRFMGLFPFSVAEVCIYVLICLLAAGTVRTAVRMVRTRSILQPLFSWCSWILLAAGTGLFLYAAGGGINYRRTGFADTEGIETGQYSAQELADVCAWLTENVNLYQSQVERDDDGLMVPGDAADMKAGAIEAMQLLSETYTSLEGYYPQPKEVFASGVLSSAGITGVYSFFTIEANYNGDMTGYNIPFTMCHELSHLRGFMEEKEANFIAFLACIGSDDADFCYSGYLSGWIYCMNDLLKADTESWRALREELADEVYADLQANTEYWNSHEGTVSDVQDTLNDTYLKANGQSDGILSYQRVVDLIIAYYKEYVE